MTKREALTAAREWSRKYLGCFVGKFSDGYAVTGCHPRVYGGQFIAEYWQGKRRP